MINFSQNELISTITKAFVGAQFPRSHGIQIAKTILYCRTTIDQKKIWNDLLSALYNGFTKLNIPHQEKNSLCYTHFCSASDVIHLCDLLECFKHITHVKIINHTHFYVLLVVLQYFCMRNSYSITISDNTTTYASITMEDILLYHLPHHSHEIELFLTMVVTSHKSTSSYQRIDIEENIVQELQKFVQKTYVPTNETSRTEGAGSQINDNE